MTSWFSQIRGVGDHLRLSFGPILGLNGPSRNVPFTRSQAPPLRRSRARSYRRFAGLIAIAAALAATLVPSQTQDATASVTIYRPDQVIRFVGSGWGHGIGMSQWGAKGRAERRMTAPQIISAYYQGTALTPSPTESTQIRVLVDEDYLPPAIDGSFPSSNKLPGDLFGRGGPWAIEGVTGPLQPGTRLNLVSLAGGHGIHARLYDPAGNPMIEFPFPGTLKIVPLSPQTRIQPYYDYTGVVPGTGGTLFYDTYRGVIWIRQNSQGLLDTVNELNIEDYLRGVVPAEMPVDWPHEALRAQAMAARTYALSELKPFHPTHDLDDTTFYQAYEGSNIEHPATNAAVDSTRNTVISYGGQPIVAYYFSGGSGFTENVEDVQASPPLPYLRGIADVDGNGMPFDSQAPRRQWATAEFPMRVLEDMLNVKPDTTVGSLHMIDFSDRSHSGRLRTVHVHGSTASRRLPAHRFQALFNRLTPEELGPLNSTNFQIEFQYPLTRPVPDLNLPGNQSIYFAETGHNVLFGFKKYFESRGGVEAFGLPLTEEFVEGGLTVQYFERARFEYHPELAGTKYEVQLGLLGDQITAGSRPLPGVAPFPNEPEHRYFPETGHSVNFAFLKYWEKQGALDSLGYPISEELFEQGAPVQYFQRARLEYRPELGGPFGVVKGKIGVEYLRVRGLLP